MARKVRKVSKQGVVSNGGKQGLPTKGTKAYYKAIGAKGGAWIQDAAAMKWHSMGKLSKQERRAAWEAKRQEAKAKKAARVKAQKLAQARKASKQAPSPVAA